MWHAKIIHTLDGTSAARWFALTRSYGGCCWKNRIWAPLSLARRFTSGRKRCVLDCSSMLRSLISWRRSISVRTYEKNGIQVGKAKDCSVLQEERSTVNVQVGDGHAVNVHSLSKMSSNNSRMNGDLLVARKTRWWGVGSEWVHPVERLYVVEDDGFDRSTLAVVAKSVPHRVHRQWESRSQLETSSRDKRTSVLFGNSSLFSLLWKESGRSTRADRFFLEDAVFDRSFETSLTVNAK